MSKPQYSLYRSNCSYSMHGSMARVWTKRLDETQWPETRDETLVRLETVSRLPICVHIGG